MQLRRNAGNEVRFHMISSLWETIIRRPQLRLLTETQTTHRAANLGAGLSMLLAEGDRYCTGERYKMHAKEVV